MRTSLLVLLVPMLGWAASPRRVVVAAPPASVAVVEGALGKAFTVVPHEPLDDGQSAALVELARAEKAQAVVTVAPGASEDVLDVFNGLDGRSLAHLVLKHPKKGLKALPKASTTQLLKVLATAKPPKPSVASRPVAAAPPPDAPRAAPGPSSSAEPAAPAPTPEPAAPKEGKAPTPTSTATTGTTGSVVKMALGVRTFQRSLSWTDDLFKRMPGYTMPFGPAVTVDAELTPFTLLGSGPLAGLGATASFEESLGLVAVDQSNQRFSTGFMRFRAGAQYVLPVSIVSLRVHAGWSMQSYTFSATSTEAAPRLNLPNVRYATVRGGLGLQVRVVGPLSLEVGAAYQYVLSAGELSSTSYFPRAKVGGLDATAGLVFRVVPQLEVKLGVEYQRYWMSLNPNPGDRWIVGGALDEYRSANLSLGWAI